MGRPSNWKFGRNRTRVQTKTSDAANRNDFDWGTNIIPNDVFRLIHYSNTTFILVLHLDLLVPFCNSNFFNCWQSQICWNAFSYNPLQSTPSAAAPTPLKSNLKDMIATCGALYKQLAVTAEDGEKYGMLLEESFCYTAPVRLINTPLQRK